MPYNRQLPPDEFNDMIVEPLPVYSQSFMLQLKLFTIMLQNKILLAIAEARYQMQKPLYLSATTLNN